MTKKSRRSPARVNRATTKPEKGVKSRRTRKTSARAMRQVAKLIREVVALEKRAGGRSSVFSLRRLPETKPRRTGATERRRRKR